MFVRRSCASDSCREERPGMHVFAAVANGCSILPKGLAVWRDQMSFSFLFLPELFERSPRFLSPLTFPAFLWTPEA